ncbi:MAG: nuclear transport factor 2 family protein [Actinobacteria bacterium]|nr:nuclear transport factor 2 family protein [Actinomycetota bacterium]
MSSNGRSLEERLAEVETKLAIQELACNYVHGMDKAEKDRFMDCWTDDAKFIIGGAWGEFIGKEAIANGFDAFQYAFFEMHHFTTGHQILSIDGDTATGQCDAFVAGTDSGGTAISAAASYKDLYRREADGKWRFSSREIIIHFLVPWLKPQGMEEETRGYHTPELGAELVRLGMERLGVTV